MSKRRRYSAEFKFQVALEAAKGQKTISELAGEFGVHPNQVSRWKQELLQEGAHLFASQRAKQRREQEALQAELYQQIGRLKMELEWLKKRLPDTIEAKRAMIERDHATISVRRQCELIGLNRSSLYYQPAGESPYHLLLMRLIDEQYLRAPFYGWPRQGGAYRSHRVSLTRVFRLPFSRQEFPRRHACQWTILAENRWPHVGRKLTLLRKVEECGLTSCASAALAAPSNTMGHPLNPKRSKREPGPGRRLHALVSPPHSIAKTRNQSTYRG